MGTDRTYATRYDLDRLRKSAKFQASVDTKALTSTALLSSPITDLAGDIVVPEGMDWSRHMRDPRVDIEHRRHPDFGDATVGWAHTGLMKGDGYYTVRHVPLEFEGGKRSLPVGTTHFDPDDRLQVQVFAMVERDILPAVSIEFVPDMTCAKALGPSPLERRQAYRFEKTYPVCYTVCERGVCPDALVAKSAYDPLAAVLAANRIGDEQLHPVILKAFAHRVPGKASVVTSGFVGVKAMDETPAPTVDSAPAEAAAQQPASNGITRLYDHAQAMMDMLDQLEADAEGTDNPAVMQDTLKFCEMGRAYAEKVMASADKHDAKLQAAKGKGDAESEKKESDDYEPDMGRDDDGNLKAIPPRHAVVVKAMRGRRFRLAEIQKAEAEQSAAKKDAAEQAAPGDGPEDVAYLEQQTRLYEKDLLLYG